MRRAIAAVHPFARRLVSGLTLLAVGCSSTPPVQHRDGMALVEAGRYEQGLAVLEEAAHTDANNAAARMMLYAGREHAVSSLLAEAQKAAASGQPADAIAAYTRAQSISPKDARIAQGLGQLEQREARAENARRPQPRAAAEAAAEPPQLRSRLTSPVTLEFRDANIKMVFDVLARAGGIGDHDRPRCSVKWTAWAPTS